MVSTSRKRESRKTENCKLRRNAIVLGVILRNHGLAVMPRRRLLSSRESRIYLRRMAGSPEPKQDKGVARNNNQIPPGTG